MANPLPTASKTDIMKEKDAHVLIPRDELEKEHRLLVARVQQLRQLLGYKPLPTGKEQRRINR